MSRDPEVRGRHKKVVGARVTPLSRRSTSARSVGSRRSRVSSFRGDAVTRVSRVCPKDGVTKRLANHLLGARLAVPRLACMASK
jgi:hypothetical protein